MIVAANRKMATAVPALGLSRIRGISDYAGIPASLQETKLDNAGGAN
jgi:hypothetical protein